jgi:4-diphosphocytidyl-2-C-methyl-D-erythritol kinase
MGNAAFPLTIEAPVKVNLHLVIRDRRPDGFHNLESIFLALAFGDILHFEPVASENTLEIHLEGENSGVIALPPEKNIISGAVSLFRSKTGYNQGLRIRVEKRIPLGGGLGGGSSDAASTLLALNKLAADGRGGLIHQDSLVEMAASLGSDIPFFLYKTGAAWVSGRGEIIRPIEAPQLYKPGLFFVLVNPGFPSETAAAFRLLEQFLAGQKSGSAERLCGTGIESGEQALMQALAGHPRNWPFRNDFLPVFEGQTQNTGKTYSDIITQLRKLGADFAGLTGAGSTCFGVFTRKALAEKACESLKKTWNYTIITFPLAFEPMTVLE